MEIKPTPEQMDRAEKLYREHRTTGWDGTDVPAAIVAAILQSEQQQAELLRLEWREGPPPKPWSGEWFIAETTYGDRVCLTALPEEWTYDFKTADDTYIKADKIKRWMQFPDSHYIAPSNSAQADLQRMIVQLGENAAQAAKEYAAEKAELTKRADAMALALERCAVIVDRNNWRQNEKVDDVKLIAREASAAYREYQKGRSDG